MSAHTRTRKRSDLKSPELTTPKARPLTDCRVCGRHVVFVGRGEVCDQCRGPAPANHPLREALTIFKELDAARQTAQPTPRPGQCR